MATLYESGIRPAIDDYMIKVAAEKRDYGDYWSASSAGYCMRKVMFERMGIPPITEDARKYKVFESGKIFHGWMQEITKKAGLSIAQELELQDESLMIRGHIDDLILINDMKPGGVIPFEGKPGGEGEQKAIAAHQHLILYDYKTQNSRAFSYQADKGRKLSRYHRYQLGTYMYMLRGDSRFTSPALIKQLDGKDVILSQIKTLSEARIMYISKDDLRMSELQLLWSSELETDVLGYWRTLNEHWKNQTLPPCSCADYEKNDKTGVGFMADKKYNPFFYEGEPCSIEWYKKCRAEQL